MFQGVDFSVLAELRSGKCSRFDARRDALHIQAGYNATTDAPGVTLTGHSRASKLQAGSADPPVSAQQGASVPIKLLHSSQSSSYMAASMLRCTSSADHTSTSSQHLRSAGICCRWSDDV